MKRNVNELANAIAMDYSGKSLHDVLESTDDLRYLLNLLIECMDAPSNEKMAIYKTIGDYGRMHTDWSMGLVLYKTNYRFRADFEELHRIYVAPETLYVHVD